MKKLSKNSGHDLIGRASIDMDAKINFNELASKLIPNYNPDRFDPILLKLYVQKSRSIITLYALDRFRQGRSSVPKNKLPVKKFKIFMSFDEFITHIQRMALSVTNNAYDIKDMLVNK